MENEKTDRRALLPVEEVDSELICEPNHAESSLIGYGFRKICRTSIVSQLNTSHQGIFHTNQDKIKWNTSPVGKRATVFRTILNVIKSHGIISRYEIMKITGFSLPGVICTLNELVSMGFIEEGRLGRTYYYRIANL